MRPHWHELAELYLRRLRSQSFGQTLQDISHPQRLRRHLGLILGGRASSSNSYLPSWRSAAEVAFCAQLLDCEPEQIKLLFAELQEDREILCHLRDQYARFRPDKEIMIGRFQMWYAITRLLRPKTIVETGVHDGLSSAVILCALDRNEHGRLISIDLPSTDLPLGVKGPGWLVPNRLHGRWSLQLGNARKVLPSVSVASRPIDVFIHDSDHSSVHQEFEFRTVRPFLSPAALLISDHAYPHEPLLDELAREWSGTALRVQTTDPTVDTAPSYAGAIRFDEPNVHQ
jgi:hypothetical protein